MSLEKYALDTLRRYTKQEWIKLEVELRDYGMPRAVDTSHELGHDRPFSLPGLPWLLSGWAVDQVGRGD
jgi:hypothetical protein